VRRVGKAAARCDIGDRSVRTGEQPRSGSQAHLLSERLRALARFRLEKPLQLTRRQIELARQLFERQRSSDVLLHQDNRALHFRMRRRFEPRRMRLRRVAFLHFADQQDA